MPTIDNSSWINGEFLHTSQYVFFYLFFFAMALWAYDTDNRDDRDDDYNIDDPEYRYETSNDENDVLYYEDPNDESIITQNDDVRNYTPVYSEKLITESSNKNMEAYKALFAKPPIDEAEWERMLMEHEQEQAKKPKSYDYNFPDNTYTLSQGETLVADTTRWPLILTDHDDGTKEICWPTCIDKHTLLYAKRPQYKDFGIKLIDDQKRQSYVLIAHEFLLVFCYHHPIPEKQTMRKSFTYDVIRKQMLKEIWCTNTEMSFEVMTKIWVEFCIWEFKKNNGTA